MWLYVSGGFVSVVAHRTEHDTCLSVHVTPITSEPSYLAQRSSIFHRPIIHTVPWHGAAMYTEP